MTFNYCVRISDNDRAIYKWEIDLDFVHVVEGNKEIKLKMFWATIKCQFCQYRMLHLLFVKFWSGTSWIVKTKGL